MTTGTPAPHAYVCPACGRKHGADLSAMEGHPEVHGKVHCMGCHALLWLSLHADGTPKCELFEAHRHDVQAGLTPAAAPATRSSPMLPA
ncbi:MAG: hypothetical protein O2894_12620, partial [Planctomycetota bacterium]|nr:hypothetical protein [Planctomycetota bacterium]